MRYKMGILYFKAELLDDIVLSQRTATVGEHKSLDYIPGSVFLGIAASKHYSKINKDDAWNECARRNADVADILKTHSRNRIIERRENLEDWLNNL
jgi:hypothetical protein